MEYKACYVTGFMALKFFIGLSSSIAYLINCMPVLCSTFIEPVFSAWALPIIIVEASCVKPYCNLAVAIARCPLHCSQLQAHSPKLL